jgi:hypothetical protein
MSKTTAPRAHPVFAPRSLVVRQTITIEVSPEELYKLVCVLEAEAEHAAEYSDRIGYADYLFQRIAALREAAR